jgi:hypothetical protein
VRNWQGRQGSNLRQPVLETDSVCVRRYRVVILCRVLLGFRYYSVTLSTA